MIKITTWYSHAGAKKYLQHYPAADVNRHRRNVVRTDNNMLGPHMIIRATWLDKGYITKFETEFVTGAKVKPRRLKKWQRKKRRKDRRKNKRLQIA